MFDISITISSALMPDLKWIIQMHIGNEIPLIQKLQNYDSNLKIHFYLVDSSINVSPNLKLFVTE